MDAQISNEMLRKSRPDSRLINFATLCRPFAMTDFLRQKFPTFGNNQRPSTKMRAISNSPRDVEGRKVATLKPTGARKVYFPMYTRLPNMALSGLDEKTNHQLTNASPSEFKEMYYEMAAEMASDYQKKPPYLPILPFFEMENPYWSKIEKGLVHLRWSAAGVSTQEKEAGVLHHVTLETVTRLAFFAHIPDTKDRTWPRYLSQSDFLCDGTDCTNSLRVCDWPTPYFSTPPPPLLLCVDLETHNAPYQLDLLDVLQMDKNMILVNRQPMYLRNDSKRMLDKVRERLPVMHPLHTAHAGGPGIEPGTNVTQKIGDPLQGEDMPGPKAGVLAARCRNSDA